jgi:hypothetical protein
VKEVENNDAWLVSKRKKKSKCVHKTAEDEVIRLSRQQKEK